MEPRVLHIGEVARQSGVSIDTIRFYEKAGVLPRPARSKGGYRIYEKRELEDLEFIQNAQQLGFSLKEIHELFAIQRHPQEACATVRDLIAQKLAVVRSKIEQLQTLESALADANKTCRKALRNSSSHSDICPVLERFVAAPPQSTLPRRKKREN